MFVQTWGDYMSKTFDKIMAVFGKNLAYTIILIIAIIFFVYFSDGVINGIVAALSALIAFICIMALYYEFKKAFSGKKSVATVTAKKTSVKKTATKKSSKK